jgi:hypothetical protein
MGLRSYLTGSDYARVEDNTQTLLLGLWCDKSPGLNYRTSHPSLTAPVPSNLGPRNKNGTQLFFLVSHSLPLFYFHKVMGASNSQSVRSEIIVGGVDTAQFPVPGRGKMATFPDDQKRT